MAIFSDTVDMNTLLDTLWYFCYITVELVVLFIAITALIEIILMYIPQDKISKKLPPFSEFLSTSGLKLQSLSV